MLDYTKLLKLMSDRGITSYVVQREKLMAMQTLHDIKQGKGGLNHVTINRLCQFFECQPNDLIEYVSDEAKEKD